MKQYQLTAMKHTYQLRGMANLVPRGRDPFVQRRGSLTSGRIRKKPSLIGR